MRVLTQRRRRVQVQKCTLLSIKTGGCPEDCNYCSQSSKHSESTGTKATKLLGLDEVYEAAVRAKEAGSTRFCMGAAWRGPSQVRRPALCTVSVVHSSCSPSHWYLINTRVSDTLVLWLAYLLTRRDWQPSPLDTVWAVWPPGLCHMD